MTRLITIFVMIFILCGCSSTRYEAPLTYLSARDIAHSISLDEFTHCHGYGCKFKPKTELNKKEFKRIKKNFKPAAKTPEQERKKIANAIADFEIIIGQKMGTDEDIAETFIEFGDFQHDCSDESVNTTIYLSLLEQNNLLKFHRVRTPRARFPLMRGSFWPHQSAMIEDIATGEIYAVDSWFHDNGAPAEVHPYKQWKSNQITVRMDNDA